jgi:TIR domain-containing protein
MARVFISYASADESFARMLVTDLEAAGIDVWFDEDEIVAGQSVIERINKGLSDFDFTLLLISSAFLASNWTKSETNAAIAAAIDSQRNSVIPVLIEDVWNNVPLLIRDKHYADFRLHVNLLHYQHELAELLQTLLGPSVIARTMRRPVVTVTGERNIEERKTMEVAHNLGRRLAELRLQLRTGVAQGVDEFFAKGAVEELIAAGEVPRSFLTCFTVRGRKPVTIPLGRFVESALHSREEGVPELIADSDILVILGGKKNTSYIGMLGLFENKIVLPVGCLDGASADLFSLILSRYKKIFGSMLARERFLDLADMARSPSEVAEVCVSLVKLTSGL